MVPHPLTLLRLTLWPLIPARSPTPRRTFRPRSRRRSRRPPRPSPPPRHTNRETSIHRTTASVSSSKVT